MTRKHWVALPLALVAALVAACSGGSSDSPTAGSSSAPPTQESSAATEPTADQDAGLESQDATVAMMDSLPESFKGKALKGAMTDGMAPWSVLDADSRKPSGADVDLLNEAAKRLGMTIDWVDIQFAAAIPGIQSGRYDVYASAMADRLDRQEAVNFIDYSVEGSGVVVPKGNPKDVTEYTDLCGLRAQYTSGSLFPDFIAALNEDTCKDDPISGAESPDTKSTYLAVASGQADITFDTYGTASYNFNVAKVADAVDVELSPIPPFAPARQGIAFSKSNPDLQLAMAGAMQQMLEDGTYESILDEWGVADLIVDKVRINSPLDSKLTDFLER